MRNIAIVEDENKAADVLKSYIDEYAQKNNQHFEVHRFTNGVDFLESYKSTYAVVFMDIQMPYKNGMDVAVALDSYVVSARILYF